MVEPPLTGSVLYNLRENPGNDANWDRFVRTYTPLYMAWLRRSLNYVDALDVAQNLLLKLVRVVQQYNPKRRPFRAFLRMLVNHATAEFHKKRGQRPHRSLDGHDITIPSEVLAYMELEIRDLERSALRRAIANLKAGARGNGVRDLEVFEAARLRDVPFKEIARRFSLSVGNAYQIVSRVQKNVAEKVRSLKDDCDDQSR